MVVGENRLAAQGRRLGEPPRMRELQGDDEVVGAAMPAAVGITEGREQRFKALATTDRPAELVGVGAAFGHDSHGLAPPDQLGTALAEALPTAEEDGSGPAVVCGVPALHRMDAPAVARATVPKIDRRGQWRTLLRREHRVVERNRRLQRGEMGSQVGCRAKSGDARIPRLLAGHGIGCLIQWLWWPEGIYTEKGVAALLPPLW